jgi:hypothetical protein
MQLQALIHILKAASSLVLPEKIYVMGSSSLLPSLPHLADQGQPLECSYDADLLVQPISRDQAALLHEAIGEGSLFHQQYGYHADILLPLFAETLPADWESRAIPIPDLPHCKTLHPLDLAAAKICLGRAKDFAVCSSLVKLGIVSLEDLRDSWKNISLQDEQIVRYCTHVRQLEASLASGG